jgi:hypothetical protein
MQINLELRHAGSTLVYGIPLWFRVVSGTITGVLVLVSIVTGSLGIGGAVITALALVATLYEERWIFDPEHDMCEGLVGLVFAARKTRIALSDIEQLRIDVFAKGRLDQRDRPADDKLLPGSQARLTIETKLGDHYMVDSVSVRRKPALVQAATLLAACCGVELEE